MFVCSKRVSCCLTLVEKLEAAQAQKVKKNAHTRSRTEDLMIDFVLVMRFTTKPCELIGGSLFHLWLYEPIPVKSLEIQKNPLLGIYLRNIQMVILDSKR